MDLHRQDNDLPLRMHETNLARLDHDSDSTCVSVGMELDLTSNILLWGKNDAR
jgi:hypothetical protein